MNTLKKILFTRDSFYKHLTLLSLSGIMGICLLYMFSYFCYDIPLMSYFSIKATFPEALLAIALFLFLFVSLSGYFLELSSRNINLKFEFVEFSLKYYSKFFKILPIIFVWLMYFIILDLLLKHSLIANIIVSFLQIFLWVLIVIFSKDFKLEKKYFNPLSIFKILNKIIFPLIKFCIIFFLVFIILMGITSLIIVYTNILSFPLATGLRILWGSVLIYLYWIFNIAFVLYIGDEYQKDEFFHREEVNNI